MCTANSVSGQLSQYLGSYIFAQDSALTYLGKASSNPFESDSITNTYGSYGSPFSSTSIRNTYSNFGSAFATYSAYNSFTSSPPILYTLSGGRYIAQAYLTKNTFLYPRVDPDLLLAYLTSLGSVPVASTAILMSGTFSYSGVGSAITYGVDTITNYRPVGTTSGTLALQLWATAAVHTGGTLNGYKLIESALGVLQGGYHWSNTSRSGTINTIPSGNYNIVFVLAEWNGSAYVTLDYGNFSQRQNIGPTAVAPTITTQPGSKSAVVGASVSFNVSASGTASLSYQWYKNGTTILGATTAAYTINSVTLSDAGNYSVIVRNTAGSVTSNSVALTVSAGGVTTEYAPSASAFDYAIMRQTITAGTLPFAGAGSANTVALTLGNFMTYDVTSQLTNAVGVYTYTKTGANTANLAVTRTDIASDFTPSDTLTFTSPNTGTFSMAGTYGGNTGTAQGTFTITYLRPFTIGFLAPDSSAFEYAIMSSTVSSASAPFAGVGSSNTMAHMTGNFSSFNVTGQLSPAVGTYSYAKTGTNTGNLAMTRTNITPTFSPSDLLTFTGPNAGTFLMAGTYGGNTGTAQGTFTITYLQPATAPAIVTQPISQTAVVGQSVSLYVMAEGTSVLTYQWYKDGSVLAGATASTYTLPSAQSVNNGSYTVTVSNTEGRATSDAAVLSVSTSASPPSITNNLSSLTALVGNNVSFTVAVSGTAPYTYQWKKDGANIANATAAAYTISSVTLSDAGSYWVVVSNSVGSATSNAAVLTVNAPVSSPSIINSLGSLTVSAGNSMSMTVGVSGTAPFTYQWKKGGANISGATLATYTISSVTLSDAGSYSVVVSNSVGSATSNTAVLTVSPTASLSITTHPTALAVTTGGSASFMVAVSGSPPYTYQWKKNSTDISGATQATYTIASVASIDAGSYSVTVSNSSGSATSRAATLTTSIAVTAQYYFTTIAGTATLTGVANGTGGAARLNAPISLAVDNSGNVFVADTGNSTIRKITSGGVVTTFAGTAGSVGSVDGTGSAARFQNPYGIAVDSAGNIYVSDTGNATIRKITSGGVVTTLAGLVGNAGSTDGTGSAARFWGPSGLAVDSSGNIYVADSSGWTIRKVTPVGVVTTLAGTAGSSGSSNGTGSVARFYYPQGVAVDNAGSVYVGDNNNSTIRKITSSGVVTTIAGTAGVAGSADGTGSAARFNYPWGVAVDSAGNIYVADWYNHTIRKITSSGVVTTLSGLVGVAGSSDGAGSTARFYNPTGVAVDSGGTVYVADTNNSTIRRGVLPLAVITSPTIASGTAGQAFAYTATFSGAPTSYSATGLPSGLSIDAASGVISGTPNSAGTYIITLRATNGAGTSSTTFILTIVAAALGEVPTRLTNLSVRIGAGTGDSTLIVGFVVGGSATSGTKPLLIRAVGPTLASYGVTGTLIDPNLELIAQGASTALASNDNWSGAAQITSVGNTLGAFPMMSALSKDAALYLTPAGGVYTAKVTGVGGTSGIALAEIYDASSTAYAATTPRLINVSARAQVGTGDGVLIAGFVVDGAASRTVLIRAVGPTLGTYGVGGVLADPQLELTKTVNNATVVVATNDNWAGDAQITSVGTAVGAFSLSSASSKDAAILVTLPPGVYSAKASGVGNTTGVALIEVYEVQ